MAAHFGITETAVAYVAESFKDYWLGAGKAKADWKATFRNWIRKEIERNDGVKVPAGWNDGGSSDGGSADDEAYREIAMFLLGSFYRRGGEGKAAWTQKQQDFFQSCAPGLPRCTIDPELIAAARAASSSKIAA